MIYQREDGTLEGVPEGSTVRRVMVREQTYGSFKGGDPREFQQDPECSTENEKAAHREACARWDAGDQVESEPGRCLVPATLTYRAEGEEEARPHDVLACSSGAFGLGTYEIELEALEVTHPDGRVEVYL